MANLDRLKMGSDKVHAHGEILAFHVAVKHIPGKSIFVGGFYSTFCEFSGLV